MQEEAIETWHIHNRINLYLLASLEEDHLNDMSASRGRTVGEQFAHIHNVRLMWLKVSMPERLESLDKFEKGQALNIDVLSAALEKSGNAVADLLARGLAEGRVKGFKPHPSAFLGYLISHESHHRGQILLSLKQSGHPVDKKIQFGIWEWGVR
ncbi:MAG: DinB family protein [Saprospiraceae bacterium]|nr:DinB family protein [Saprospiraceae bacterium]